jgi:hypothetical protein
MSRDTHVGRAPLPAKRHPPPAGRGAREGTWPADARDGLQSSLGKPVATPLSSFGAGMKKEREHQWGARGF